MINCCSECGKTPKPPRRKTCSKECGRIRQLKQMVAHNVRRQEENKRKRIHGRQLQNKADCKKYLPKHGNLLLRTGRHWSKNKAYQKMKKYLKSIAP